MRRLKKFPVEGLSVTRATFSAHIVFNPFAQIPPALWYTFGLDLAPIDLGKQAVDPVEYEQILETDIELGGIELPFRRWNEIEGEFGPIPDQGASSIYVSCVHNPIDIRSLKMHRIRSNRWQINTDIMIDFENAQAGYRNVEASLSFRASFGGISFYIPSWTSKPKFPSRWKIPSVFNQRTVDALVARFVDLDVYRNPPGKPLGNRSRP